MAGILRGRSKWDTQIGALLLTSAAINDVVAWCLLEFVLAAINAREFMSAVVTTTSALALVDSMTGVVRPLLARVHARFGYAEAQSQTAVAVTFFLLLGSALISEHSGIHALWGALLFGAAVPRAGQANHVQKSV